MGMGENSMLLWLSAQEIPYYSC